MADQCGFLEKCGFFANYKGNTEVIKQGWVRMYCESEEKRPARPQARRHMPLEGVRRD